MIRGSCLCGATRFEMAGLTMIQELELSSTSLSAQRLPGMKSRAMLRSLTSARPR